MKRISLVGILLLAAGCNGSNDTVFQYVDANGRARVNFAWRNKYSSGIPENSYRHTVHVELDQGVSNTVADAFRRRAEGVFGRSEGGEEHEGMPGAARRELTVGDILRDFHAGGYRSGKVSETMERIQRAHLERD